MKPVTRYERRPTPFWRVRRLRIPKGDAYKISQSMIEASSAETSNQHEQVDMYAELVDMSLKDVVLAKNHDTVRICKPRKPNLTSRLVRRTSVKRRKALRVILAELDIEKEILEREELVQRIAHTIREVHDAAQCIASSDNLMIPASGTPKNSGPIIARIRQAQCDVTKDGARAKIQVRKRLEQIEVDILHLRSATVKIVELIESWRASQNDNSSLSDTVDRKMHFYAWKGGNVKNYMLKMDTDLRSCFPSLCMALKLGLETGYNPLLLSQNALDALYACNNQSERTFITQSETSAALQDSDIKTVIGMLSECLDVSGVWNKSAHWVYPMTSSQMSSYTSCLESLARESNFEQTQARQKEQEAIAEHGPFDDIKSFESLEVIFSGVATGFTNHSRLLQQQLHGRQQYVCRRRFGGTSKATQQRNHYMFDTSRAKKSRPASCYAKYDISPKYNRSQAEQYLDAKRIAKARQIQTQYRVYRFRKTVSTCLSAWILAAHLSSIKIQSIFRKRKSKLSAIPPKRLQVHQENVDDVVCIHDAFTLTEPKSVTFSNSSQIEDRTMEEEVLKQLRLLGSMRRKVRETVMEEQKHIRERVRQARCVAASRIQLKYRSFQAKRMLQLLRNKENTYEGAAYRIQCFFRECTTSRVEKMRDCVRRIQQRRLALRLGTAFSSHLARKVNEGAWEQDNGEGLSIAIRVDRIEKKDILIPAIAIMQPSTYPVILKEPQPCQKTANRSAREIDIRRNHDLSLPPLRRQSTALLLPEIEKILLKMKSPIIGDRITRQRSCIARRKSKLSALVQ